MDESFDQALSSSQSDLDIWPAADSGLVYPGPLTISEMTQQFGISARALRFYEAKGLLSPRRQGAARLYGRTDCERLTLVLRAKRLGFTLAEIRRMLSGPAEPAEAAELSIPRRQCLDQIKHLEQRKREIEAALAELRRTYSSFYARMVGSGG